MMLFRRHFNYWYAELKRWQQEDEVTYRPSMLTSAVLIRLCVGQAPLPLPAGKQSSGKDGVLHLIFYVPTLLSMQQQAWSTFRSHWNFQADTLNAVINKTLFDIALEQEYVLSCLNFPHFSHDFLVLLQNSYSSPEVAERIRLQRRMLYRLLSYRFDPSVGNELRVIPNGM